MSYGLYKYIVAKELSGDTGNIEFRIELWKKSYSGSTEQLEGAGSYFDHNYTKIDSRNPFNKPVNDSDLSMFFHVQNSSHLALLTEIQNADEDEFILKKKVGSSYDWQGKVVNDLLEYEEGDYPFTGKITAKDLTYLKGQEYTLATGYEKIIVTLADVLGDLGFGIGFKTHTNWVENNSTTSDDFLNQVYHDKFAFRKYATSTTVDDQPITKYEVLERICRNHQLILRQVNGQWYIYQLSELSDPTSLNIFSYNSSGTQTGTATQDITTDIDNSDLYSLPSGSNKINPAIKKATVVFDHRTGTTEQFVNAVVLSSLTDPAIPNARFSMNFNGSGDEYVIVQGGTYAICSRDYQFNNEEFPQSAYLLKSSQYYWIEEAQKWQEVADITTTRESVAPGNIDTANNKIRLVSNDFRHGDVVRFESGFASGIDANTEYYLIDVSGEVATGSDTLYYQISTEPDGTPVNISSPSGSNKYAYRVSNRQQMTNRTVPFGGTVWWCDFSFTTSTIPSDSDSDVQFYAMGSVMPPITTDVPETQYWIYVDSTNQWRDLSVSVRDVVTSNGDSITYELEQSGNFSTELSYDSVYFGDGPLDYSRSALAITTTTPADTPTSQWDFRGGSTNSNFFKIWLKEVLNFQRGNRRNLSAELYGFYDGYQVLSYESKYFFFLGGTHTGRGNIWSGDWIEINIATGTDTFTSYVDATNSVGSGGGTGGGAPSTSEGTYLEVANNLSDVESASTSRTNLGLEIGVDVQAYSANLDSINQNLGTTDSPTFAGLTVDGLVVESEVRTLQSDVIENHLEIESLQDNKVEKGFIFPDDDGQALGTGDTPTFNGIISTGTIITDEIDTTSITWSTSTEVFSTSTEKFNNPVYISTSLDVDNGINADQHIHAGTYLKADTYLEVGTSATIGTTLDVGTNATVGGTLSVTGNTTISGTLDAPTLNTGQGDNELYAMNQDVQTTDGVIFDTLSVTNSATVGGTLGVTGATTLSSTLEVDGTITVNDDIKTADFSSWFTTTPTGYQISQAGVGDFRTLYIDELVAKAFTADVAQALAGSDILTKSVAKLNASFVVPSVGASVSITVEDLEGLTGLQVFEAGDHVRARVVDSTSGLTILDVYGTVSNYATVAGGTQTWDYTITYAGASDTAVGRTVNKGNILLDYGTSGSYYIERTVLDRSSGSDFSKVPYNRIVQWTNAVSGSPRAGDPDTVITVITQNGNLANLTSTYSEVSGFGFFGDNTFLTGTFRAGDLNADTEYIEYNAVDGLKIKVGDETDLGASVAELRQDVIDIYLADQSTFAGIQFLSGQITLKVGADGKVASARLDATGDESAITLRADFFDFQSDDIVILGDPNQDAGTQAKIALGSNVDTITVANTDSGFIASGAGEFKGYIDANNYLRLDSTGLDIKAEVFDLVAGDLSIDSSDRQIQIADSTTRKVTINDDTTFTTIQTLGTGMGTVEINELDISDGTVEDTTPVVNVSTYKGDRIDFSVTIDYTETAIGTANTLVGVSLELAEEGGVANYAEETFVFHRFTTTGNGSVTLSGSFKTQTNDLNPASGFGYRLRFYANEGGQREGDLDFDYTITIYNQETQINKGGFISQSSPTNFISDEKIAGNFELDVPIVTGLTYNDLFPYRGKVVKYQSESDKTGTNPATGGSVTIKPYQIIQLDFTEV